MNFCEKTDDSYLAKIKFEDLLKETLNLVDKDEKSDEL